MGKEAFLIFLMLVSGCVGQQAETTRDVAIRECTQLCTARYEEGLDLTNGPCISDGESRWTVDDWVCDIAHSPRTEADNNPANQCADYREGRASHFVEVDEYCQMIQAV